jgi:hypothetical protein
VGALQRRQRARLAAADGDDDPEDAEAAALRPQDVELPSPFAIGDSSEGLGSRTPTARRSCCSGERRTPSSSTSTLPESPRHGGLGRGRVVAALRETGDVVLLKATGRLRGRRRTLWGGEGDRTRPAGLVVQLEGSVERRTPTE